MSMRVRVEMTDEETGNVWVHEGRLLDFLLEEERESIDVTTFGGPREFISGVPSDRTASLRFEVRRSSLTVAEIPGRTIVSLLPLKRSPSVARDPDPLPERRIDLSTV